MASTLLVFLKFIAGQWHCFQALASVQHAAHAVAWQWSLTGYNNAPMTSQQGIIIAS